MTSCWICGSATAADPTLRRWRFARCTRCSFVFRPDLEEAASESYESGAYEQMRGDHYTARELEERRRDARVRLACLAPHRPGARLLDVGAAGGAFVAEAAAAGYAAGGVEPTPAFARHAREALGVDVKEGTLEDLELPSGSLDVVTMWHVLEHIPRPVEQLRRVAAALTRGGRLAVEVPNSGGVAARREGASWPSLEPDVHVNQFTPATLSATLRRAGFRELDLYTLPITPYLPRRARIAPRHLAARAKAALWLRDPRARHPHGHELLRAIAVAEADPAP